MLLFLNLMLFKRLIFGIFSVVIFVVVIGLYKVIFMDGILLEDKIVFFIWFGVLMLFFEFK